MSDFNADKYNSPAVSRDTTSSGLTAGVESGLSMVEGIPQGSIQPEQKTKGSIFRTETVETPVSHDGKNFTIRN